jgi:alpha-tubulin suppressor-like RCC1 family protein
MATTVTLGKLRFDVKGDYSTSTSYLANDIVTYRNQQYICTTNVNSTSTGEITPLGTTYWNTFGSLFNFRGTWTNSIQYKVGDVVNQLTTGTVFPSNVNYNLSRQVRKSYICIQNHTSSGSINPVDTAYWTTMNAMGTLNTQTSAGAATANYNIGVYGDSHYIANTFPNRGIVFDNSTFYRGGGYKNTVESISCGYISNNGQAMTWGTGQSGSLGMSDPTQSTGVFNITFTFYDWWRSTSNTGGTGVHATPDNQMPRVIQWEKSYNGNTVLMNSGEVFAWGYGGNGENGDGSTSNRPIPVRVGGTLNNVYNVVQASHLFWNVRIKRIAMSGGCGTADDPRHTLALDENGQVWTWGYNAFGQLGDNTTVSKSVPTLIPKSAFGNKDIVAIWAHGNRTGWSMAVDSSGSLWSWGYNVQGQLGVGDVTNRSLPTLVSSVSFGGGGVGNIVKINATDRWNGSVGEGCTAILTDTGRVYVSGLQGSAWMGLGTTTQQNSFSNVGSGPGTIANSVAKDMWLVGSGGNRTTMYIESSGDNTLYACGYNLRGQLARGGSATTQQSTFDKCKMSIGGVLYDMVNVKRMAFSGQDDVCSVFAILDNGLPLSCGDNNVGQLSNGTLTQLQINFSDTNNIESQATYAFQMMRGATDMIGNCADVMGFGYDPSNYYFATLWLNNQGRVMVNGRGNQGQIAQYSGGIVDALNSGIMMPLPIF